MQRMPTSLDNIVAVVASNSLLAHDWSCFLHIYSRVAVVFCRGFRGSLMCVIGAMEREPSPEGTSMSNISLKAIENCLQQCVPIDEHLKRPMDTLLDLDVAYRMCMEQLIASERMLRRKNLSIDEMNKLLDRAERELVLAQEIAYWKRNALLSTDKHLCTITGRKNKPKPEKPVVAKVKARAKKTTTSTVKENIRRSERERRSPCVVKTKEKETPTTVVVTPETNVQLACRTKRKSKESDCGTDSSSRKRTSGRLAKPARKKQPATAVASTSPAVAADEPTYCLCEQISFGEMIGCDNEKCLVEWFHFECVQLKVKPKGKWYCPMCRGDRFNVLKSSLAR
uniref:PHD-type domain-containing protein n=3 Tax=Parascaris univalens TaxID=6257 RepID=A0A915CCV0_PARUN